ncbi:PaaI family thioesterase [Agromyces bauzanensis]
MADVTALRSKTFEWVDPLATADQVMGMSGLEYMHAVRDGTAAWPPMGVLMNLELVEAERGRVVLACTPGEEHYNPLGIIHGGLLCTLLDTVIGCATHTTLERGTGYTSIELKVSYLRPVTLDTGLLTATGSVIKEGRRVVFAEGGVSDAEGTLVATASSSLLVLSSR